MLSIYYLKSYFVSLKSIVNLNYCIFKHESKNKSSDSEKNTFDIK